jgi:glycosyltransferase involved in cell wall biosynthesis
MRYLWDDADNYFRFGRGRSWKRAALQIVSPALRRFDLHTANGVDHFIANSETVRRRIQRLYRREATVIPPPVDTDFFRPALHSSETCHSSTTRQSKSGYYLIVSSLEPYKRIDLALEAFERLGRPLRIAGSGTQAKALRRAAGKNVTFLGRVSDADLLELYQNCHAVIVPGIEDFGIVPVEALACGKPVVCCGSGGVTETVTDGETGLYFWPQRPEALAEAIVRSEALCWDQDRLRRSALRFSRERFRAGMREFLAAHLGLDFDSRIARGAFQAVSAG